ncbi:MAG: hypothetical protein PVH61_30300 [Candidatus Aminicenantes bacterium]
MKNITNYNVQNYKPNGIHASMHPCNHAVTKYHSNSPLFPIFLSSQLPSFPLHPLAAGGSRLLHPIHGPGVFLRTMHQLKPNRVTAPGGGRRRQRRIRMGSSKIMNDE